LRNHSDALLSPADRHLESPRVRDLATALARGGERCWFDHLNCDTGPVPLRVSLGDSEQGAQSPVSLVFCKNA